MRKERYIVEIGARDELEKVDEKRVDEERRGYLQTATVSVPPPFKDACRQTRQGLERTRSQEGSWSEACQDRMCVS